MTEEVFLELMAAKHPDLPVALKAFLADALWPDWKASLNLKWDSDTATVNLAYIRKDGAVATDATSYTARARRPLAAISKGSQRSPAVSWSRRATLDLMWPQPMVGRTSGSSSSCQTRRAPGSS